MQSLLIIVHSFIELSNVLFGIPGVEYILSEKFCQDSVESFFGKQRARGGRNETPMSNSSWTTLCPYGFKVLLP